MSNRVLMVPARLNSTRLPRKLSLDLGGEPVLAKTLKQALKTTSFSKIVLATDSIELSEIGLALGVHVVMTPPACSNGSERCAYALESGIDGDTIVLLQGDEPFIDPLLLDELAYSLDDGLSEMVSAMYPIDDISVLLDPSVVKVVCNLDSEALYFSRSPIPFINEVLPNPLPKEGYWGHIGVYGYQRESLLKYPFLHVPMMEKQESLEQLRVLYARWRIKMLHWHKQSTGINTEADLLKARTWLKTQSL